MPQGSVPSVSVVMPAYNAEKYLREAIDSILAQTYTDFEFIIINDGSTDKTKEIILGYSDPRIVYLENEQNSGICVTLNKGLDAARGRYIARMDADDISLPDRFDVQVRYMDTHPEIGVCGSDIEVFGEGIEGYKFDYVTNSAQCAAGLLFNSCFCHPTVVIRKRILDDFNLRYEDSYRGVEDFKMWWEIARHCKLSNINQTLLKYRHHKSQVTQNVKPATWQMSNEFRAHRYESFGLELTHAEKQIVNDYSYGEYYRFGLQEFDSFLAILSNVCTSHTIPISTDRASLNIVCGKAIAYTISQSANLRPHARTLLTKALVKGVIPLKWYFKYFFSTFKRTHE